jgi:hypothetical protein
MINLTGKTVAVLTATYNDWPSLAVLLPLIDAAVAETGARARIVVVDDGSTQVDGRSQVAESRFQAIESVEEVMLGANQGNQRAVAIGIAHIAAHVPCDYMVVLDSDHEDPPRYISQLLATCAGSGDTRIVFAERSQRSEGRAFKAFYRIYRWLYQALTGLPISVGNFSVVPGSMVARLAYSGELWNHYPAAIMRARLPFLKIPAARGKRIHGKSTMNLVRLVVHAFSGFTVHSDVVAVRVMLATMVAALGIIAVASIYVSLGLLEQIAPLGWPSLMAGILIMILLQIMTPAVFLLFLSLSLRLQPPLIPAHDYVRFVLSITRLYPVPPMARVSDSRMAAALT